MPKGISQTQIARELGVSQSLVSIVLNGREDGIAQQTYESIWNYALQNGYSPKGMKISGGTTKGLGSMQTVGYFLRAPMKLSNTSNFFSHVAQGLHDYLREKHHNLVFLGSESDLTPQELRTAYWKNKTVTGIVVMGEVDSDFLAAIREMNKSLVYLGARSPGYCHSVNANEYQAAEQLVDHLYGLGHRNFAFLGGTRAKSRNEERLLGLSRALARYNLTIPESAIFTVEDAERLQGYQIAERLLNANLKPFPTAWVCINGLLARGAINRLFKEGLMAGREVSVAAFDNTRVCSDEFPGLTSASSVPEDLGREAGRILLNPGLCEGDSLLDVVLPSKFFERESVGPLGIIQSP